MSNLLHPGLMLLSGSLLLLVLPDKWIKAVMPAAALCAFVAVFTLREGDGMFLQLLPQLRMQFLAVDRLSWAFVLIFAIGGCWRVCLPAIRKTSLRLLRRRLMRAVRWGLCWQATGSR